MIVKITQADINKAKEARREFDAREVWNYSRAETCPLAFALRRIFPKYRITVSEFTIYDNYHAGGKKLCDVTDDMKLFIQETDRKKDKIRPRELEVPIE